jgi:hypothetical protein
MNLLVAALLLLQDNPAEDALKKIEATVANAKTVSVVFQCTGHAPVAGEGRDLKIAGSILLKDPNRIHLAQTMTVGGQDGELSQVSDGETLRRTWPGGVQDSNKTPEALLINIRTALVRTGAHACYSGSGPMGSLAAKKINMGEKLQISDVSSEPDDKGAKVISYTVTIKGSSSMRITLVYDPQKMLPVRRTVEVEHQGGKMLFNEAYSEFSLDGEIPDEKFKLPKERK